MFINHYELKVEWDLSAGVLYTLKAGPSTWVPPFLWLWMTADDFYRSLTSHTLHTFVGWGATHPLHKGWCPEMSQTLQIKNIQAEGRVSADPDTATNVYQVLSDRWEGFLFSLYILFCKIPLDLPVHAEKNQLICPFQTCVGVVWDVHVLSYRAPLLIIKSWLRECVFHVSAPHASCFWTDSLPSSYNVLFKTFQMNALCFRPLFSVDSVWMYLSYFREDWTSVWEILV